MSAQEVNPLVDALVHGGTPSNARLEEILDTTLAPSQDNPKWQMYSFKLKNGAFQGGEFRRSKEGDRALLVLSPRDEPTLTQHDLDLKPWGSVRNIDINPRIPPEGTDAYVYDVDGARLSFQFTHNSRKLRNVAMEWGREKT
jgi:hypothetical protein